MPESVVVIWASDRKNLGSNPGHGGLLCELENKLHYEVEYRYQPARAALYAKPSLVNTPVSIGQLRHIGEEVIRKMHYA